jgi:uncharacterized protein YndB with AHSA1/START domain
MTPALKASGQELVITRVFDALRDLVFKACTEPERFVQWWGPRGFTTPVCDIDLPPGQKREARGRGVSLE